MQLAIETLLDGVMRTLRDAVLPAVQDRFARGQLFAVLDVLQNLRDRVEPKAALDEAEAASADDALGAGRRGAGAMPARRSRVRWPRRPRRRRRRGRRRCARDRHGVRAARRRARRRRGGGARARSPQHLAAQAMRDVALLKPSLLQEISKG